LSTVVDLPSGPLELHHAHIPSARNRGVIQIETCEALTERLARPSDRHRVLCGDLNLPRAETMEGEVITFAEDHPEMLERWDHAERSILPGLAEWGLRDVFRELHGFVDHDFGGNVAAELQLRECEQQDSAADRVEVLEAARRLPSDELVERSDIVDHRRE